METIKRKENGVVIVAIKGRLDAESSPDLGKEIEKVMAEGEDRLILDVHELNYISSAGLRIILATSKKLKERKGKIFLTGLHGPVEEVFKISGFISIFRVFATAEAALKEI